MAAGAGDPGERHRAQATSFGAAAAAYERGRPPYPRRRSTGCCPPARRGYSTLGRHREAHPPAARPRPRRGRGGAAGRDARGTGPGRARRPGARRAAPRRSRCPTAASTPSWSPRRGTGWTRPGRCPRWPGCWSPAAGSACVEYPGRAGGLGGRAHRMLTTPARAGRPDHPHGVIGPAVRAGRAH